MKATDLMIGDFVLLGDTAVKILSINLYNGEDSMGGKYYVITEPQLAHTNSWVDMLEPIPLTPEILEKNYGKETQVGISDKPCWGEMGAIWSTMLWKCENSFWLEVNTIAGGFVKKHIRYVHELQHALRLCGIEKEVKL
jgi:hypothetical protein